MRIVAPILVVVLFSCVITGCIGPRIYDGHRGEHLFHYIEKVQVFDDCVSIQGGWNDIWAVYNYGVKVFDAHDDTGNQLEFRSMQFFWMKDMRFELELSPPSPDAKYVSLDIAFLSKGGVQRFQETLPLDRSANESYATQRKMFEKRPSVMPSSSSGRK